MAFARNQWYVAAYGSEVGRGACSPARCSVSRWCSTAPGPGRRSRSPTGACTGASRCRRAASTATRSSAATTASPTTRPARASSYPARSASRAPRGWPRYPVVEQDSFVWVWIGDPDRADPAAIPRAPWLADPRLRDGPRAWSRWTRGTACWSTTSWTCPTRPTCTAATSARRRWPRPRSPPRSTRTGRSSTSAGTWTTPSARRSTRAPPASRAGSPAGRTSSTTRPASTCCTAASRRRVSTRPPTASDREAFHAEIVYAITPSTEHTTLRLLGGRARLRDRRRVGQRVPPRQQPHRGHAGRDRAQPPGAGASRPSRTATRS